MGRGKQIRSLNVAALWAILVFVVLVTGFAGLISSHAIAQSPSDPKKFIDDDEDILKYEEVPACQESTNKISELVNEAKSFYVESSKVINELDILRDKYTPTEIEKAKITELEAKHAKIEADLAANKAELEKLSNKSGPSDECKSALIKSVAKNTIKHADRLPESLSKLDAVTQVVEKVEKILPALKKASSNETLIKSIEEDIITINANIEILKVFFIDIKKEMDSFIALYNSNPIAAYDKINKFGQDDSFQDVSKFKKAGAASESIVAALNRLEKSLEILANTATPASPTPSS
ncbi:MAG: hypothetical protein WAP74_03095 [Patescibacteria group bacterium]